MAVALMTVTVLALAATATGAQGTGVGATVVVATADSSERSRALADFVGDGQGDQDEINAAIRALPPVGGTVLLMEGTYDIRRVEGTLGGVLIERSKVTLAGQGPATRLVQAPGQDTNVIRIIGSGVGDVTIRDLYVDANRDENSAGTGDPNVSHGRFEFCGIKAWRQAPGGEPAAEDCHDITIRNCQVHDAHRLGIMLEGRNMRVLDNVLGNAGSDAVEILTGPGEIRGNYVVITGQTHVGIGSDRGNSIVMADNVVHVRAGGRLDIGLRSWADSRRHVMSGNVVTVDPGGVCTRAMDVRGDGAVVTGNCIHGPEEGERILLSLRGGNTVVTGNLLENAVVDVNDETGKGLPILVYANIMHNAEIAHTAGELRLRPE